MRNMVQRIMEIIKKSFGIRSKILVSSCTIMLLITSAIGSISYIITYETIKRKTIEINYNYLIAVREGIEGVLDEVEKTCDIIENNNNIVNALSIYNENNASPIERLNTEKKIGLLLESIMEYQKEVERAVILTEDGHFYWEKDKRSHDDYKELLQNLNYTDFVTTEKKYFFRKIEYAVDDRIAYTIEYVKKFPLGVNDKEAVLLLSVNESQLTRMIDMEDVFILNEDNNLIGSSSAIKNDAFLQTAFLGQNGTKDNISFQGSYQDRKGIFLKILCEDRGLKILNFISNDNLMHDVDKIRLTVIFFIILSLVSGSSLSLFFTSRITSKIVVLADGLKRMSNSRMELLTQENQHKDKRKLLSGQSYFRKLLAYYMLFVMIPSVLLTVVLTKVSRDVILLKVTDSYHVTFTKIINNTNSYLEKQDKLSKYLLFNEDIKVLMEKWNTSSNSRNILSGPDILKFGDVLHKWNINYGGNDDISIYNRNGEFIFSSALYASEGNLTRIIGEDVLKDSDNPEKKLLFVNTRKTKLNKNIFSICRRFHNIDNPFGKENEGGFIVLNIDEQYLEDNYRNIKFGNGGIVYIVDEKFSVVSHPDKKQIGIIENDRELKNIVNNESGYCNINGENHLVFISKLDYGNWSMIAAVPLSTILGESNLIVMYNFYLLLGAVVVVILISMRVSRLLTRPLGLIKRGMEQVADGNFNITVNYQTNDEIDILIINFNDMVRRIRELIEQVYEAEIRENQLKAKEKEAELYALQAQINPHFLYNTLGTVSAAIRMKETKDAIEMINALAQLFRINISRESNFVYIAEEVAHVAAYLNIQKLRYEDKFDYVINTDEDVLKCKTIKLILQPIVENCIFHGIEMKKGKGKIIIEVKKRDGDIIFTVGDNGVGMSDEELCELNRRLFEDKNGKNIGLKNVYERIRIYFGDEYMVKIDSNKEKGTVVTINIPVVI